MPHREAWLKPGVLQDALLANTHFAIIATDLAGIIRQFSVGAERLSGYLAADIVGLIALRDLLDPLPSRAQAQSPGLECVLTLTPGFDALMFKASRDIENFDDLTCIRKDGGRFSVRASICAFRDMQGTITGYLLIGSEHTLREPAAPLLRQNEALFRAFFDRGPIAMYFCDVHGIIREFNQCAVDLWGCAPKATETDAEFGRRLKFSPPDGTSMPDPQTLMTQVLEGKLPAVRDVDVLIERPDGSRITVITNIVPIRNVQAEIIGAVNCFCDISARKTSELNLSHALAVAEKANLEKSAFLARMSHDLRTPLSAILGYAQLMESGSPPPTDSQKRSIDRIQRAGWQLLEMLNTILDLAQIESREKQSS